jgi:alpha-ketoglutarate-dependent 2,4-dichlorophenoxyacetate dioxygenase
VAFTETWYILNYHRSLIADPDYIVREEDLQLKPGAYHRLIQQHPSGSRTMFIGSHAEKVVGMSDEEGLELITELIRHASQPKYFWRAKWNGPGDMVMWDNRTVMHKATMWDGMTEVVRDMRRTSVLDDTKDGHGVQVD